MITRWVVSRNENKVLLHPKEINFKYNIKQKKPGMREYILCVSIFYEVQKEIKLKSYEN